MTLPMAHSRFYLPPRAMHVGWLLTESRSFPGLIPPHSDLILYVFLQRHEALHKHGTDTFPARSSSRKSTKHQGGRNGGKIHVVVAFLRGGMNSRLFPLGRTERAYTLCRGHGSVHQGFDVRPNMELDTTQYTLSVMIDEAVALP